MAGSPHSKASDTKYYDLLGVSPKATTAEIRKGYRRAALKCHPDRVGDSAESNSAFQNLQRAYNALYNVETRRIYDEFGAAGLSEELEDGVLSRAHGARSAAISAEDIASFATDYRYSDMEKEDLTLFFTRFAGDVRDVLDFIPYSEPADLTRFLDVFDECADADAAAYRKAGKILRKRAKRVPQRAHGALVPQGDDAGTKERDGMDSLVKALAQRNGARAAQFNSWVEGLAEKYPDEDEKGKKKSRKGKSTSRGVQKKTKGVKRSRRS